MPWVNCRGQPEPFPNPPNQNGLIVNGSSLQPVAQPGNVDSLEKTIFDLILIEHGVYSLSVNLIDHSSGLTGWFSCIYGPSTNWEKIDF